MFSEHEALVTNNVIEQYHHNLYESRLLRHLQTCKYKLMELGRWHSAVLFYDTGISDLEVTATSNQNFVLYLVSRDLVSLPLPIFLLLLSSLKITWKVFQVIEGAWSGVLKKQTKCVFEVGAIIRCYLKNKTKTQLHNQNQVFFRRVFNQ